MSIDKIDQLLLGLLKEQEAKDIFEQISSDPLLSNEYNIRKKEIELIELNGRARLKEQLRSIHENEFGRKGRSRSKILLLVLVLFSLIIGLLLYINMTDDTTSKQVPMEQLFAANYRPYDYANVTRSGNIDQLSSVSELYRTGRYIEVVEEIEDLSSKDQRLSVVRLMKGISHIELSQDSEAIMALEAIIKSGDFNYEDQANWYLAMIYLKNGDNISARAMLERLVLDSESDFYREANEVLLGL